MAKNTLISKVIQAGNVMSGERDKILLSFELTQATFGMLGVLIETDGQRISDLAHEVGELPTSFTYRVDDLVSKGLVERRDNPSDRRSKRLYITQKGREVFEKVQKADQNRMNELQARLTREERSELSRLLEKLTTE